MSELGGRGPKDEDSGTGGEGGDAPEAADARETPEGPRDRGVDGPRARLGAQERTENWEQTLRDATAMDRGSERRAAELDRIIGSPDAARNAPRVLGEALEVRFEVEAPDGRVAELDARTRAARTLAENGKPEEALSVLERGQGLRTPDGRTTDDGFREAALALAENGHPDQAVSALDSIRDSGAKDAACEAIVESGSRGEIPQAGQFQPDVVSVAQRMSSDERKQGRVRDAMGRDDLDGGADLAEMIKDDDARIATQVELVGKAWRDAGGPVPYGSDHYPTVRGLINRVDDLEVAANLRSITENLSPEDW